MPKMQHMQDDPRGLHYSANPKQDFAREAVLDRWTLIPPAERAKQLDRAHQELIGAAAVGGSLRDTAAAWAEYRNLRDSHQKLLRIGR